MMKNIALFALTIAILSGCGPAQQPVQNEFLLNTKQAGDVKLARIGEEVDVAEGMMFLLDEAKIVTSIPNLDPDSPFDRIFSKASSFLVCKATVWKTKPEAQFPEYDVISVIPSFGTLTTDQFIIRHAEMAYGTSLFDPTKITADRQKFLFVYEIEFDEPGWSYHFYKENNGKIEIYRIIDSGT